MHAYIIEGGTKEGRAQKIEDTLASYRLSPTEIHIMLHEEHEENESIGIAMVRENIRLLSLRPIASKNNALVVPDAELLTVEAQNALLKTLEEPPGHTIIVLGLPDTSLLLPTIISRCLVVRLSPPHPSAVNSSLLENIQKLISSSAGGCMNTNVFQNKEEALAYLANLEQAISTRLHQQEGTQATLFSCVHIYRGLTTLRRHMAQNVNTKLACDWFFLHAATYQNET